MVRKSIIFLFGFACLALASLGRAINVAVDYAFEVLPRLVDPRVAIFTHPGHPRSPLASMRAGMA